MLIDSSDSLVSLFKLVLRGTDFMTLFFGVLQLPCGFIAWYLLLKILGIITTQYAKYNFWLSWKPLVTQGEIQPRRGKIDAR